MYGLDLFAGIGGITLAIQDYVTPLAYCEIDPYPQSVLLQRMQEGYLPKAPIWDDIRTLQAKELPRIDIIYGGFPCQDISIAGRQKGLEGERSGLFFEILRLLDETQAPFIFLENVPNIRTKGAERVCKELAERGYDCRWCNISARDVGARHKRERWFLLAHTNGGQCGQQESRGTREEETEKVGERKNNDSARVACGAGEVWLPDKRHATITSSEGLEGQCKPERIQPTYPYISNACGWKVEPEMGRMVNGLPNRTHRIKALGNSVVPLQVKKAFEILIGETL